MKTVISASRRTDIPAFYLSWFMKKIREGEISVENPIYRKYTTKVNLHPDNVAWIVFWSRNYSKFLKNRSFFSDYRLFFHFTIVSHHPDLEIKHLQQQKAIEQMEALVNLYGPDRVIWRYDPIVIWKNVDQIHTNYDSKNFEYLCAKISGLDVRQCYFSFATPYHKFRKRFKKKYPLCSLLTDHEGGGDKFLEEMQSITAAYKMRLFSCCNDALTGQNIYKGRCISGPKLNQLSPDVKVSEAKHVTREACGCTRSIDVGDYIRQPCHYGCIYCYANPVWE